VKLTVLGCDGSYAGAGGACTGYLVQGGGVNLWLDAGPGTLANLQRHVDLDAIDGIVLTHAHPDHWVDFLPYHNVIRYIRKRSGLPIWSPRKVRDLAEAVNGELTHSVGCACRSPAPTTRRRRWPSASTSSVARRSRSAPTPARSGRSASSGRVSTPHCAKPRCARARRAWRPT
jgi:ribonuclease BN (tRNA processing enzyme)